MSLVKELGNISIKAQDKLLVEHDPHNIPPLGVKVGFYKDVSNLNSKEERSSLVTKVKAFPFLPMRPVRPVR